MTLKGTPVSMVPVDNRNRGYRGTPLLCTLTISQMHPNAPASCKASATLTLVPLCLWGKGGGKRRRKHSAHAQRAGHTHNISAQPKGDTPCSCLPARSPLPTYSLLAFQARRRTDSAPLLPSRWPRGRPPTSAARLLPARRRAGPAPAGRPRPFRVPALTWMGPPRPTRGGERPRRRQGWDGGGAPGPAPRPRSVNAPRPAPAALGLP